MGIINFSLVFNRSRILNKNNEGLIQIRAYKDRCNKYISTNIAVERCHWDFKNKRIKGTHQKSEELNQILKLKISDLESLQNELLLKKQAITFEAVLTKTEHTYDSFTDFMKKTIESDHRTSKKTKISLRNSFNKINTYKKNISFEDLTHTFVLGFDKHLKNKGGAVNTIHKHHKNLKKFINCAIRENLIKESDYPYKTFKVKYENKTREVLSFEELTKIENLNLGAFNDNKYNDIRDMFLFACYTGLRISDILQLSKNHVKNNIKGYYLDLISIKAKKRAFIPLPNLFCQTNSESSKPELILKKYYIKSQNKIFPTHSEQLINRYLKLIAELAGIKKKIYFHMARHTFGTIMAHKVPLPVLQELMQHSDIKTTMIYVNLNNQMIQDSLNSIHW